MALVLANRVKETSTTTGTGTLSLAGAVTGFQTFVDGIGTTNTTYYSITDESGNFEVGLGTVTDGTPDTLSRDTVLESSNSGNKVSFGSGTKTVFVTQPSQKAVYVDGSDNVTLPGTLCVTDDIKSTNTCAGTLKVSCSGIGRTDTGGITYGAYGSHIFDSTNGYALHACCNAYALGPRAVKIDEPLDLCVGDTSYNSNSCSKLYGGVETGLKGIKVNFLMDCSACCHYVHLKTTEAYTIDNWALEGYATGIIGTCTGLIRLQKGHGPLFSCPMIDACYSCVDFYACCVQRAKVCNTGLCVNGCITTGGYTLPTADGSAGQVICTNGSGTLSFASVSGSGGSGDSVCIVTGNLDNLNSALLNLCDSWKELEIAIQADCRTFVCQYPAEPKIESVRLRHCQDYVRFDYRTTTTNNTTGLRVCSNTCDLMPDVYIGCESVMKYHFWKVCKGSAPVCNRILMEASYHGGCHGYSGTGRCDAVIITGKSDSTIYDGYSCWQFCLNAGYVIAYQGSSSVLYYPSWRCSKYVIKTVS